MKKINKKKVVENEDPEKRIEDEGEEVEEPGENQVMVNIEMVQEIQNNLSIAWAQLDFTGKDYWCQISKIQSIVY